MNTNSDIDTSSTLIQILEAIQESNNAYNWDPATFLVTLAIGILALSFALLPILQSLVFPPENLKYDQAAIGAWSRLKKKKWNSGNMRFAVTIRTPFLEIAEIANWPSDGSRSRDTREYLPFWRVFVARVRRAVSPKTVAADSILPLEDLRSSVDERRNESGRQYSFPNVSVRNMAEIRYSDGYPALDSSSAGWLSLLRSLRLEEVAFANATTRSAPATLIPSDIPAAVAYASIETLVILAAAAGCKNILLRAGFPVCISASTQLEFRSHVSLGLVAAFTRYGLEPPFRDTLKSVKLAHKCSQGILRYNGTDIENPFLKMSRIVKSKGLYEPQSLTPRLKAEFTYPATTSHLWDGHLWDYVGGSWLLFGDVPIQPQVFPSARLQVHAIASALASEDPQFTQISGSPGPLSRYGWLVGWTLPGATHYPKISGIMRETISLNNEVLQYDTLEVHSWLSPTADIRRPAWQNFEAVRTQLRGGVNIENSTIFLLDAYEACGIWLRSRDEFRERTEKHSYHPILVLQLLELDYWLHKSVVPDARFRDQVVNCAINLFSRATGLLKAAQKIQSITNEPISNHATSREEGNETMQMMRNFFEHGTDGDWTRTKGWSSRARSSFEAVYGNYNIISYGLKKYRESDHNFEQDPNAPVSRRSSHISLIDDNDNDNENENDDDKAINTQNTLPIISGPPRIQPSLSLRTVLQTLSTRPLPLGWAPATESLLTRWTREQTHFVTHQESIYLREAPMSAKEESNLIRIATANSYGVPPDSLDQHERKLREEERRSRYEARQPKPPTEDCLIFWFVYRVVLFGALLDTGADNSCMLDLEVARQIVTVL